MMVVLTEDARSTFTAPERTVQQRLDALKAANEIRVYHADRKRALKTGEVTLDEVLADPGCASLYVVQVLRSLPRFGAQKADRVIVRAGVSVAKRCGGLTERQRSALIANVGYYPAGREALL